MCGIAGIICDRLNTEALSERATAMAESIRHRGPDAEGLWCDGPAALSHRRLEVIDLDTGGQPMVSHCGRYVIVFNGEIYNFSEISDTLKACGHILRTASDTEVLLLAFMEFGPACLDQLEGMFAFAVWDRKKRSLFAARDRMGKKPFFYTHQNGSFLFASELTTLKRVPEACFTLDMRAVSQFLTCKYVPAPGTIYTEAYKLPPGHSLTFENKNVTVRRYWNLPLPTRTVSEAEAQERIRDLLTEAVSRRLVSDVPLGAFLSGGLDSSVIVNLMARLSSSPVQTYSIGFKEASFDETGYANKAARFAGVDNTVAQLSAIECSRMVGDVVGKFDEPMADPSILPTYFLCRFARQHVTVALSGDGADELFGGYEHFPAFIWAERCARLGLPVQTILSWLANLLPVSTNYISPGHAAKRFAGAVGCPSKHRVPRMLMGFSPEEQIGMWQTFPGGDAEDILGKPSNAWTEYDGQTPLNAVFSYFAGEYLPNYILTKMDRCSMLHGLEVRSPFLDTDLVEYAYSLPASLKIPGGRRKHLMKNALAEYMPDTIRKRNKRGFLMPVASWLNSSLKEHLDRFAEPGFLRRQGLFKTEVVEELMVEHASGKVDRREELWTWLVLQLWLEANGEG